MILEPGTIVYKYTSLSTCIQKSRVIDILQTEKLWFSKFHEQNDPMEGIFWHHKSDMDKARDVTTAKNRYLICSFGSHDDNSTLWAYYACGFQGVCIGVECDDNCERETMNYCYADTFNKTIDFDSKNIEQLAKNLLLTKLKFWEPEEEVRLLYKYGRSNKSKKSALIKAGIIKSLVIGCNASLEDINKIVSAIKVSPHLYDANNNHLMITIKIASPNTRNDDINKASLVPYKNLNDLCNEFKAHHAWRNTFVKKV